MLIRKVGAKAEPNKASRLACPEKGVAHIGHREMVLSDRSLKQEIRSRLGA